MKVQVIVKQSINGREVVVAKYVMNHDEQAERRVLGEQCRNAFEGGQMVITYPVT